VPGRFSRIRGRWRSLRRAQFGWALLGDYVGKDGVECSAGAICRKCWKIENEFRMLRMVSSILRIKVGWLRPPCYVAESGGEGHPTGNAMLGLLRCRRW